MLNEVKDKIPGQSEVKRKVGFTLSYATKALRESRDIVLLYFLPLH